MPSQSEPTADDASASALEAVLAGAIPEPRSTPQRSTTYANKDEFLAAMTPVAKEVAANLGVSHKIILAQAALESGWGGKVKGNNLMGIKSHGEEGGLDVVTHEIVNGKKVKITDSFRQYDTPEDSIRGYGAFLKANSRYRHFLRAGAEAEDAQLSALQSSGYATDPLYSQKLKNIIKGIPDEEGA
jgi:flagellum-specific peptidoglycan hydrolase FlgJ